MLGVLTKMDKGALFIFAICVILLIIKIVQDIKTYRKQKKAYKDPVFGELIQFMDEINNEPDPIKKQLKLSQQIIKGMSRDLAQTGTLMEHYKEALERLAHPAGFVAIGTFPTDQWGNEIRTRIDYAWDALHHYDNANCENCATTGITITDGKIERKLCDYAGKPGQFCSMWLLKTAEKEETENDNDTTPNA